ncbi:MAG: ribonuclease HI family protein [Patescibacteria group bacterium]
MPKHIRIYTDGGARGNPGPAGAGAAIHAMHEDGSEGETIATVADYLGKTTNNQAEYMAIVRGLEKAKKLGAETVEMVMDSELAVKQLNGEYRVRNPDLAKRFMEVYNLRQQFKKVTFRHIRREKNTEADGLVNEAIDKALGKT